MLSHLDDKFLEEFHKFNPTQKKKVKAAFAAWKINPFSNGLDWHRLTGYNDALKLSSVHVGDGNRAMGLTIDPKDGGESYMLWFWVGPHERYNEELKKYRQKVPEDLVNLHAANLVRWREKLLEKTKCFQPEHSTRPQPTTALLSIQPCPLDDAPPTQKANRAFLYASPLGWHCSRLLLSGLLSPSGDRWPCEANASP